MKKQRGFSLLEVMIALLIILFGVLGMMGMQAMSINNTELARYNGRAAIQAASVATTMKANSLFWTTSPLPTSVVANASSVTVNGTVVSALTGPGGTIALLDLQKWGNDIATSLPLGSLSISCVVTVTPEVCKITISWYEKTMALRGPASASSSPLSTGTHSLETYVSIL